MRNIFSGIRILSYVVVVLFFLSLFGSAAIHVSRGGQRLGIMTSPVRYLVSFPELVLKVLKSDIISGIPIYFIPKDGSFEHLNLLDRNIFALNGKYHIEDNTWQVILVNLQTGEVKHRWTVPKETFFYHEGQSSDLYRYSPPKNSILLANRSIITNNDWTKNLYCLDKNSNIVWHNTDKVFHHACNLDSAGNLWVCTRAKRKIAHHNGNKTLMYGDDFITKIDTKTGKIIYDKSVSDILIENGYKNYVFGFNNATNQNPDADPLHLNDIEVALKSTDFWNEGDLFLSLRHKSLVVQYRPGDGKIINLLFGPFLHQHDVDIISDSEISIFNNNNSSVGVDDVYPDVSYAYGEELNLGNSELLIYDFMSRTYRSKLNDHFDEEHIFSRTNGLSELLDSGEYYIESYDNAKMYIMNEDSIIWKKQWATDIPEMVELPQWMRIYENIDF